MPDISEPGLTQCPKIRIGCTVIQSISLLSMFNCLLRVSLSNYHVIFSIKNC